MGGIENEALRRRRNRSITSSPSPARAGRRSANTWLNDIPVAVVDAVATSPVIYYVHTDHLFRPVAMTDASQNIA
jgi:hypothetical protein